MFDAERKRAVWVTVRMAVSALLCSMVVAGCGLNQSSKTIKKSPVVVEDYSAVTKPAPPPLPVSPSVAETNRLADKAAALKKQKDQQLEQEAFNKRRMEAVERREREIKLQEEEQRIRHAQAHLEQKKKERALLLDAELEKVRPLLKIGKTVEAQQVIEIFKTLRGSERYKESEVAGLEREIESLKVAIGDLEQATESEEYLMQLMDEAVVLAQQGDLAAAEKRYREVLSVDPGNRGAQEGLAALSVSTVPHEQKPAQKIKVKMSKVATDKAMGKEAEGWVVQVATYAVANKKHAFELLEKLQKLGFRSGYIKKQELAGRLLYRIRVGVYQSKEVAERIRDQITPLLGEERSVSRLMYQKKG
ncbi:MAG: hypothetical protein HOA22_10300 [Gammaproteobacteria bacterium]|jgi:tetratricopeptide (TPR) repeat protein|nr:hypothetical protein [Candidatus Neomarinimicrobiota bacterium]MBT6879909.1 hypothetical protein [Gammaproteobacteria bacterium]MBT7327964.1 hypothetical protein [Gammaproteobacteria bacterium]